MSDSRLLGKRRRASLDVDGIPDSDELSNSLGQIHARLRSRLKFAFEGTHDMDQGEGPHSLPPEIADSEQDLAEEDHDHALGDELLEDLPNDASDHQQELQTLRSNESRGQIRSAPVEHVLQGESHNEIDHEEAGQEDELGGGQSQEQEGRRGSQRNDSALGDEMPASEIDQRAEAEGEIGVDLSNNAEPEPEDERQTTTQRSSAHHPDIWYAVEGILDEKAGQYLVQWADNDPNTGRRYRATWQPKTNVDDSVIVEWQEKTIKDLRRKNNRQQKEILKLRQKAR